MKKVELLAPAGNLEKAKNAFVFGADAVYLGVPDFSLRARINDFDDNKIKEIVELAHQQKKKVYVTLNIFAHNRHIKELPKHIKFLKDIKVDAIIASDPGVIATIKENWKKAVIHLSTQANCTNWQTAKFWQDQGLKRVILGRETTLEEIKEINKKCPDLELEIFVHGAMCMAYSGRCFLSKYFSDRSGNLGDCVQPCRWNYKIKGSKPSSYQKEISGGSSVSSSPYQGEVRRGSVFISEENRPDDPLELIEDKEGSYILSSKDLCLIEYLDEIAKAGVLSFKIEGRTKSVYYQAVVVNAYKQALGLLKLRIKKEELRIKLKELFDELNTRLVHRGYFTGFLFGGKGEQEITRMRTEPEWEFCGQAIKQLRIKKEELRKKVIIKVHNTLKVGDSLEIIRPGMDILKMKLKKMIDVKNNKEILEAHGGSGGQTVIVETKEEIPEYSVLRRFILK